MSVWSGRRGQGSRREWATFRILGQRRVRKRRAGRIVGEIRRLVGGDHRPRTGAATQAAPVEAPRRGAAGRGARAVGSAPRRRAILNVPNDASSHMQKPKGSCCIAREGRVMTGGVARGLRDYRDACKQGVVVPSVRIHGPACSSPARGRTRASYPGRERAGGRPARYARALREPRAVGDPEIACFFAEAGRKRGVIHRPANSRHLAYKDRVNTHEPNRNPRRVR